MRWMGSSVVGEGELNTKDLSWNVANRLLGWEAAHRASRRALGNLLRSKVSLPGMALLDCPDSRLPCVVCERMVLVSNSLGARMTGNRNERRDY